MSPATKIPLVDLKAQYATIKPEVDAAIHKVLDNCDFVMGKEVANFEADFAAYCGVKHAVGTSTGSDALVLALLACGVGPGDEVITVPTTFIATTEAISRVGARVRFIDVDERTLNMDPAKIEGALTAHTKALLPVHLYGQMAPMTEIQRIAKKHGLKIVEDAAQAHGARWNGLRAGNYSDVAIFSFYPSKNLGAYGDGGLLVTNDDEIARYLRLLRDHGSSREEKYKHMLEGYCARLDTIQAAVLRTKLPHLDEWNARRRAHAETYAQLFAGSEVVPPYVHPEAEHVYHVYGVQLPDRDRVMNELKEQSIDVRIHYPLPLHLQPPYEKLHLPLGSFPAAERANSRVMSLPMYAELTREQIETVATSVLASLARGKR